MRYTSRSALSSPQRWMRLKKRSRKKWHGETERQTCVFADGTALDQTLNRGQRANEHRGQKSKCQGAIHHEANSYQVLVENSVTSHSKHRDIDENSECLKNVERGCSKAAFRIQNDIQSQKR